MFIFDVTNPLTLFLVAVATLLLIFLGQEVKKSYIAVLPLVAHLGLLVIHTIQVLTLAPEFAELHSKLTGSIIVDFIFILVSFFAYLWVDDIEAKTANKQNLDKSLDWFWKKI